MYAIEQSKKRQTNSKDTNNYEKPLKIEFTPKQIAQFETIRVPGMNNSGGNRYKKKMEFRLSNIRYKKQKRKKKKYYLEWKCVLLLKDRLRFLKN